LYSRYGITKFTITRLQFTNDLSIFEQVNMENMTSIKFCLETDMKWCEND